MEKTMKARIQHKHDIEANWLKATNFTPLVSEIIVYDPDENYDYPRIKIGDGKTNINALPFVTKDYAKISDIPTKPQDIGALPDSTVIPTVPTKISAFENDKGYLTQHQSLDAYAKTADLGALATKDSLTASDVGALPDTTKIPSTLSDLTADSTHRTVTDTEKNTWNAKSNFSGNYNDLTNKPTIPSIEGLASTTYVDNAVKNKVDKDGNKVLSTNDYTTAEKIKLAGIATGAEVNVNADWNATSGDAQILNKPTLGSMAAKSSVAKSDLASDIQTSLGKADSALQPGDISDWAKQTSKPSYTKSEVGLGNVDNVKQYSANNPPIVVQTSAPTDTSVIWVDPDDNEVDELQDAVNLALAEAKASGEFDGTAGKDGTSVTVAEVSESTENGGINVVKFSDGKTLHIRNGKAGAGSSGMIAMPEFVNSLEECTDPEKLYVLPDGYIYAYMEHTEEVVIPGETVTIPAKAVIIHGYRYSHSGQAWGAKDGCATLIIPVEFKNAITSSNPVELWRINAKRHLSYDGVYYGTDCNTFTKQCNATALNSDYYGSSIYNIPVGKGFICTFLQTSTTDGSDLSNASFTLDGETFVPELYFSSDDASKATHATTTTTEGTTETIVTKGFVSTGHKFVADVATVSKPKSIILNNDIQPLESSISMTVPQLKKNKTIAFSGVYNGNLTEISIVQGEGTGFTECKCVVTATTITILKNNASVYTAEHGLIFGTYFSVVLATKTQNKTTAYLSSGGDTFTTGEFVWNASRNSLKLYTNVPFTQYQFAFGSNDFDKKIWMYGDSYFDHWLPVSINRGYANCLVDGCSGGGSSSGLASFKQTMEHGLPAKVVWCLGLNNKDNGAVNQSWLDCITEVKGICDANNIELWVSTIPNTPTVDNTYKNAYIRENFDHVIDLSRLVGSDDSTAWYTGLLSSDNVHPSTEGDFYIANIMETYFPEMLDM